MKKEAAIKGCELVDCSLSYWSLECELVDYSNFLLVAFLFARIWKKSRKDNYWSPACKYLYIPKMVNLPKHVHMFFVCNVTNSLNSFDAILIQFWGCRRLRTTSISYHFNIVPFLETSYHTLYREVYTGVKYVLMWSLKETIGWLRFKIVWKTWQQEIYFNFKKLYQNR